MQAEQTRHDILQAARQRFATVGYSATTLKDIAGDAGVSVQTVYDSIGSKPELVRRLNDLIDLEAGVGEIAATLHQETDPSAVVRIPARITRRLLERCGDILRASLAGSFAEPELMPLIDEGQRRHRGGAAAVASRLEDLGALRPGITSTDAANTIAALADFRLALILIDEHGLTGGQLEIWISDTTARSLMEA
jgi:AcrR family transcriptional regulator